MVKACPLSTAEDVRRLYTQLLHRDPESVEIVQGFLNRPLLDTAINFAQSSEYKSRLQKVDSHSVTRLSKTIFGASAPANDWIDQFTHIVNTHGISTFEICEYFLQIAGLADIESWPTLTKPFDGDFNSKAVTVVIPTFNSSAWVAEIVKAYRDVGIEPLFAIDSRTSDETASVLAGLDANFVFVASESPRLETLIPAIAASAPTRWILRFDDDELPSANLLGWLKDLAFDASNSIFGFPRCHLRLESGEHLERSRFIGFGPSAAYDRQWRLFPKDRVDFDNRLHTPGIIVDEGRKVQAPDAALILHFDWIIRPKEVRAKKYETYKEQNADRARAVRHFALYEDIPMAWHLFEPIEDERLGAFARELYKKGSLNATLG